MRLKTTATRDPRAEPLPLLLDDDGLARQVQSAPTAEEAWRLLDLPGGREALDPAAVEALAAGVLALCGTSDAIGKGLRAFGALDPDAEVPPAWVDRMVALHVQELEGYWALDDLAYAGLRGGGWTATEAGREPPVDDPLARTRQRARWQVETVKPAGRALWFDRLMRALDGATDLDGAKDVGRALVVEATRRRFTDWQQTRSAS